jgi:hypothetical protein
MRGSLSCFVQRAWLHFVRRNAPQTSSQQRLHSSPASGPSIVPERRRRGVASARWRREFREKFDATPVSCPKLSVTRRHIQTRTVYYPKRQHTLHGYQTIHMRYRHPRSLPPPSPPPTPTCTAATAQPRRLRRGRHTRPAQCPDGAVGLPLQQTAWPCSPSA